MDHASLDKLKVADLKKLCKERGLKVTGTKAELIASLLAAGDSAGQPHIDDSILEDAHVPDDVATAAVSDVSELNESLLESSVGLDDSAATVVASKTTLPAKKAAAAPLATASAAPAASGETVDPLDSRKQRFGIVTGDDKKQARAERFGVSAASSEEDLEKTKKRAERFGVVSAPKLIEANDTEKIKKRAEKFGVVSAAANPAVSKEITDEKLKSRAERFGVVSSATSAEKNGSSSSASNGTLEAMKKRAERFGAVTSATLGAAAEKEKILKRKEKFTGAGDVGSADAEAKKLKRQERFATSS